MDINDHVIIFALQTPPLDGKPCYAPVGEYQEKYKLEDSKWKQQIPKEFEGGYKDKINLLKISETLEIQHFTLYNEIEQNKSDSS